MGISFDKYFNCSNFSKDYLKIRCCSNTTQYFRSKMGGNKDFIKLRKNKIKIILEVFFCKDF